jgi:hypothetical protein
MARCYVLCVATTNSIQIFKMDLEDGTSEGHDIANAFNAYKCTLPADVNVGVDNK